MSFTEPAIQVLRILGVLPLDCHERYVLYMAYIQYPNYAHDGEIAEIHYRGFEQEVGMPGELLESILESLQIKGYLHVKFLGRGKVEFKIFVDNPQPKEETAKSYGDPISPARLRAAKSRYAMLRHTFFFDLSERDGSICAREGCKERESLEVDHMIPLSLGGPNRLWNMQLLCKKHNREKGSKIDWPECLMKGSI